MSSSIDPIDHGSLIPDGLHKDNLQALIELVYVKTANQLISDSLSSLESALLVTKDAIMTLTSLQNLHNQIDVKGKGTFDFDYTQGGDPEDYSDAYTSAASAFFGKPIDPIFPLSAGDPEFSDMQSQLQDAKAKLADIIDYLEQTTPAADQNNPNSLLGTLRKVYDDLGDVDSYDGVKKWVLDNYDQHGSTLSSDAGAIQNRIVLAMTAASNLNDRQSESVRRYLFIFEEYYKSASGILTKLSQLIEKMAQAISR